MSEMDEGPPLDLEVKAAVMQMLDRFREGRLQWDLVRALVLSSVILAVGIDAKEDEVHALVHDAWPRAVRALAAVRGTA